jgi:hypothetical protein
MNGRNEKRTSAKGFTLVETMQVLVILVLLLGMIVSALSTGGSVLVEFQGCSLRRNNLRLAAHQVWLDLVEAKRSDLDTVVFSDPDLGEGQVAFLVHTARDTGYQFGVDANLAPQWQGVTVYCPEQTSKGVVEFRRYSCYPAGYTIPFKFKPGNSITTDTITLRDSAEPPSQYAIDRHTGNPGANQPVEVVGTDVSLTQFTYNNPNEPVHAELTAASGDLTRYPWMSFKRDIYVYPRN